MMITGTLLGTKYSNNSNPLIPGNIRSSKIRSKCPVSNKSAPCTPSAAQIVLYCSRRKVDSIRCAIAASSSMINMRCMYLLLLSCFSHHTIEMCQRCKNVLSFLKLLLFVETSKFYLNTSKTCYYKKIRQDSDAYLMLLSSAGSFTFSLYRNFITQSFRHSSIILTC